MIRTAQSSQKGMFHTVQSSQIDMLHAAQSVQTVNTGILCEF